MAAICIYAHSPHLPPTLNHLPPSNNLLQLLQALMTDESVTRAFVIFTIVWKNALHLLQCLEVPLCSPPPFSA